MNDTPHVSICIPAYGRPEELRVAIASVLSQEFEDLEVVVGDDSGDLEPVVRGFNTPRVRYIRNSHRLGMAGNWNAVLDEANGRLRGLLMDDDRLLPDFLHSVVSQFKEDPSLGVVFTNHFFEEGGRLWERRCNLGQGRYEQFLPHLLEHLPVAVSAALMREEVWEQVRPLPDLKTADVIMHVRAAIAGWPFYYLDRPLMAYRLHPGQLSGQEEFREDGVPAWDHFKFDDPACEALRRRRLAAALTSRAASHLKHRRNEQALRDISRALEFDRSAVGARGLIVRYLAKHPLLGRVAVESLRRARLISREAE